MCTNITIGMKIKHFYILNIFLFASILVSCEKDEIIEIDEDITFGIRHDRPLSEYEDIAASANADLPDFSVVVSFSYSLDGSSNREFVATGTLVDDQWILTAGHNFYIAEEQDNPAPVSGIQVKVGNDPNNPDATYTVAEIIFHPSWLAGDQDYNDANDLCLVKLSNPITNLTPAVIHSTDDEEFGSIVWHCGFGDYSRLEGQDPDLDSKKHAIQNTLDRVQGGFETSAGGENYTGGLLAFDFDNPSGTINSLGDDFISEDESYLGTGSSMAEALDFEGTTVEGDSGGPLFINNNGNWELAGVLAGGAFDPIDNHSDGSYGDISIYIRTSTSYSWIQSVIQ